MFISRVAAVAVSIGLATAAFADAAPQPFSLDIKADPAQKGKPATAKVKIAAAPSYHMNKEFPTVLTLTPPAGVTVVKAKLAGADAKIEEKTIEFEVAYTLAEAGKKELPGELKFAVCSAESCLPQKVKIAMQLSAK